MTAGDLALLGLGIAMAALRFEGVRRAGLRPVPGPGRLNDLA
jgi:hypothetical protein